MGSIPGAVNSMHMTFVTLISCGNCNVCLKRSKIKKRQRGRVWPILLKNIFIRSNVIYIWPIAITSVSDLILCSVFNEPSKKYLNSLYNAINVLLLTSVSRYNRGKVDREGYCN